MVSGEIAIESLIVVYDNLQIRTDSDIELQAINTSLDRKLKPR